MLVLLWTSPHAFKGKYHTILCSCVKSFQIGLKFLDQNIMSKLKAKTFSCDSNKNIKFKDSDFGWFCVTGSRKKNQFCSFFHPRCGRFKSKKHEPVIIFNLWLSGKVFFSIRRFFSRSYFFVGVFSTGGVFALTSSGPREGRAMIFKRPSEWTLR